MSEEIIQTAPKITQSFAKKHCFLCSAARYLTAFALGIIVGLVWGSF